MMIKDFPLLKRRVAFREATDSHQASSKNTTADKVAYHQPVIKPDSHQASNTQSVTGKISSSSAIDENIKMEWEKTFSVGPGLYNTGNSCFLNAALQCLTYVAPLANYCLASENHVNSCKIQGFCSLCVFSKHVSTVFRKHNGPILPKSFIHGLRNIARHMKHSRQEDAHEFLRFLVDSLQERDKAGMIRKMFAGSLCSLVTCLRCGHVSEKIDPALDLSLDINHSNSLDRALSQFCRVEKLDGRNRYKCEKCGKLSDAKKSMAIHNVPPVMTIQLKRFEFGLFGGTRKLSKFVSFPETLSASRLTGNSDHSKLNYKLCAVLVHSGAGSGSGHYYSFVKSPSAMWYRMDDSDVSAVKLNTVLSQHAYVLFYALEPNSALYKIKPNPNLDDQPKKALPTKDLTKILSKTDNISTAATAPPAIKPPSQDVSKSQNNTDLLKNAAFIQRDNNSAGGQDVPIKQFTVLPAKSNTPASPAATITHTTWKTSFDLAQNPKTARKRPSKMDLEYDRGRVKKIKKRNTWKIFECPNLFTEAQMKRNLHK